jgi:hypothetical protein
MIRSASTAPNSARSASTAASQPRPIVEIMFIAVSFGRLPD